MCIRDRRDSAQCSARCASAAYRYGAPQSGKSDACAWRRACLLYTSDAADERSSVDLGGRRIIKKKKEVDMTRLTGRSNRQE